jgi:hypothetical protein
MPVITWIAMCGKSRDIRGCAMWRELRSDEAGGWSGRFCPGPWEMGMRGESGVAIVGSEGRWPRGWSRG